MEKEESSGSILRDVLDLAIYLFCVFIAVFLILNFVGQRTTVSGSSMEDTLSDGDNLIVDKLSYHFREPERFEVIVFPYRYAENTYYIKRIIGLPGESVWIDKEGNIYINGQVLEENYGLETIEYAGLAETPVLLGDDEYFVMGDNRNNSEDSRFPDVANLKRDEIIGRAWVRIYPFNEMEFVSKIK
ncbi:MAG: signal peptidase I [Lachnospiraceae bacterium]|nr:signal peptidase I [Lachnospiraceae bacterium]